jgi:hypothetical protein
VGTNDTFWCVTRNWLDKGQRKPVSPDKLYDAARA